MTRNKRALRPWRGGLTTAGLGLAAAALCGCTSVVAVEHTGPRAVMACSVPPGHLPPPGQCRIWDPSLPPGQQAPPGDCRDLQLRVPLGACLVYGD